VFFFECEFGCRGNYLADTPGVKCPKCDDQMRAKCRYLPMPEHEMKLFKSKRCDARVVTDASGTPCPCPDGCRQKLAEPCQYVPPQQAVVPGGGFVQGIVRYTVTDSLAVAPMSSSVALLSTFAALDLGAVQEKTVQLGHTEVRTFCFETGQKLCPQSIDSEIKWRCEDCIFLNSVTCYSSCCRLWKF
jgi:hypothetical protein